ncbi:hypothetical protein [Leptolyngbya sp. FACHB-711]|uniref:hypothetical protein n=1 Tax=unclassified Leptolyngbya TaxID=2650499 RepID=UPI001687E7C8|nr:hypothetical protein [Leptolyngbya sp. FACHB-711]MBD1850894.1 hypothetical protein [Cyanobacteria bacterium FACHB-502]MBD2027801.1 hypothetical protein [Leptolyngbya sp. FACHB-711]
MTYPTEPQTAVGQILPARFEREAVNILLIGNPAAVEQCVIELERKGFCDSYAWSPALPLPENASVIKPQPGAVMRVYKRWYPPAQRIPL